MLMNASWEQIFATGMHFAPTILVYTNAPVCKATKGMAMIVEVRR